jgi:hypothetical protein
MALDQSPSMRYVEDYSPANHPSLAASACLLCKKLAWLDRVAEAKGNIEENNNEERREIRLRGDDTLYEKDRRSRRARLKRARCIHRKMYVCILISLHE